MQAIGAVAMPRATKFGPGGESDRDADGEREPRADLDHQQRRVEAELPATGEEAARVVGEPEAEERGDQDPVEGVVVIEQLALDRPASDQQQITVATANSVVWMTAAERSASVVGAPCCARSASVLASSCSTGRKRVEASRKTTDQRITMSP